MKNKFYFLLTTLILWGLCNSCENQEFDSLWDQKVETKSISNEEYVTVKFQLKGGGMVIANSESLDEFYLFQDEELYVKKDEKITFEVVEGYFKYWFDGNSEAIVEVVAEKDCMIVGAVFHPRLFLEIKGRGQMMVNGNTIQGPGSFSFVSLENDNFVISEVTSYDYWLESLWGSNGIFYSGFESLNLENNLTLYADFHEYNVVLFIREDSYVESNAYDLFLDGYEYDIEYQIQPFVYVGGFSSVEIHNAYLQKDGLKGLIVNRGNRRLYITTEFAGDRKNIILEKDQEESLKFSSAIYSEDRRLDLNISVSYN